MAQTSVDGGQTSDGDVLNAGDLQFVYGVAINTVINDGGRQTLVPAYGSARDVTVNPGGVQSVGYMSYGTILNGGQQDFVPYTVPRAGLTYLGEAVRTVVNAGGVHNAQAVARETIINAGGVQYVTGTVYDTVVNAGGTQYLIAGNAYDTRLMQGGLIVLNADYVPGGTVSFVPSSNLLNVNDDGKTYVIDLSGDYATTSFVLTSAGGRLAVSAQPLCFARGTRIRTPRGEVPIDELRPGDDVVTARGKVRQVRWIGCSAAIVGDDNRPVVIRAGALPDGGPTRDVRVTRHHSFLFGDVLIPIGALVNDGSIVWDGTARAVEMFHLALDVHDVVFASGARAETFRDVGNRAGFYRQNGEAGDLRAMPTCAPVVSRGPIVDRTRRRLAERAARAGEAFDRPLRAVAGP